MVKWCIVRIYDPRTKVRGSLQRICPEPNIIYTLIRYSGDTILICLWRQHLCLDNYVMSTLVQLVLAVASTWRWLRNGRTRRAARKTPSPRVTCTVWWYIYIYVYRKCMESNDMQWCAAEWLYMCIYCIREGSTNHNTVVWLHITFLVVRNCKIMFL